MKTQISLGIHRVWSETSLSAWRKLVSFNSYPLSAQQRLWSDWADAQADLSLRWVQCHFVGFVMRRLNFSLQICHLVLIFPGIARTLLEAWWTWPARPPTDVHQHHWGGSSMVSTILTGLSMKLQSTLMVGFPFKISLLVIKGVQCDKNDNCAIIISF